MIIVVVAVHGCPRAAAWGTAHRPNTKTWRTTVTTIRRDMGGYYADPDVPVDQSNTHMIFGARCVETHTPITTTIGDDNNQRREEMTIVNVQPVSHDDTVVHEYGPAMIQRLLNNNNNNNMDWHDQRLLEVGASSTCLAACRVLPDSARSIITVCHPDEPRLKMLEHAHQFFNPPGRHQLHTMVLPNDNEPLPEADIVVVTLEDDSLVKRLEQALALPGPPRIFVPSQLLSPEQLRHYRYQEDTMNGVTEILALA